MKALALVLFGSLFVATTACQIDVDDHCDDGDNDWDDDDDGEPCETHVHADTTTATGSTGAGGAGNSAGGSASGSGSGSEAGGAGGAGGTAGGAGLASSSNDSGGSAGAGAADTGGAGTGSDTGSTDGGACTECSGVPGDSACLWGTTAMNSCCSVEVLVDVAAAECDAYGLTLADYQLEAACDTGHEQVRYQCCLADADSCESNSITLESCVSESILATMAQQLCEETGHSAMQLAPTEACDEGGYRAAEFVCCPAG